MLVPAGRWAQELVLVVARLHYLPTISAAPGKRLVSRMGVAPYCKPLCVAK